MNAVGVSVERVERVPLGERTTVIRLFGTGELPGGVVASTGGREIAPLPDPSTPPATGWRVAFAVPAEASERPLELVGGDVRVPVPDAATLRLRIEFAAVCEALASHKREASDLEDRLAESEAAAAAAAQDTVAAHQQIVELEHALSDVAAARDSAMAAQTTERRRVDEAERRHSKAAWEAHAAEERAAAADARAEAATARADRSDSALDGLLAELAAAMDARDVAMAERAAAVAVLEHELSAHDAAVAALNDELAATRRRLDELEDLGTIPAPLVSRAQPRG